MCVCGARFTTFERVQFREIMVVKKMEENHLLIEINLSKSIYIALKKRPIDTETAEKFISKISRALEELGQSEISTNTIGTMVMEGLKDLIQLLMLDLHLFIEILEKKKILCNSWTN